SRSAAILRDAHLTHCGGAEKGQKGDSPWLTRNGCGAEPSPEHTSVPVLSCLYGSGAGRHRLRVRNLVGLGISRLPGRFSENARMISSAASSTRAFSGTPDQKSRECTAGGGCATDRKFQMQGPDRNCRLEEVYFSPGRLLQLFTHFIACISTSA